MTMEELEAQCMSMSNEVDTEIVDGDPREIPSFDGGTLYVWLVPEHSGGHEAAGQGPSVSSASMLVRGRFGERDQVAKSVPELAHKLGAIPA